MLGTVLVGVAILFLVLICAVGLILAFRDARRYSMLKIFFVGVAVLFLISASVIGVGFIVRDASQRVPEKPNVNYVYTISGGKLMATFKIKGFVANADLSGNAVVFHPMDGGIIEWRGEYFCSDRKLAFDEVRDLQTKEKE